MNRFKHIMKSVVIILITLMALLPFYILLILAMTPPSVNFTEEFVIVPRMYFKNFLDAWQTSQIGQAIVNSLVITVGAIAIVVFFGSMAGYAVARIKNKMNQIIFTIMLGCMMIPGIINTVPLYTLMIDINGINTYWAMILILATNVLPFSTFLYSGFIKGVPKTLEEAAIIDGTTRIGAFFKIVFPLLKPVTSSIIIINGLSIWNNYAQAVFFLQKQSMRTIPLAISMFFQQYGAKWNLMAAAAMIGLAPAVITFLVFQKYFIKGITAGAVKG
ncbi:carbohydrate ABC transporter permease [Vallitaleaceae bacterium 9-2]